MYLNGVLVTGINAHYAIIKPPTLFHRGPTIGWRQNERELSGMYLTNLTPKVLQTPLPQYPPPTTTTPPHPSHWPSSSMHWLQWHVFNGTYCEQQFISSSHDSYNYFFHIFSNTRSIIPYYIQINFHLTT